MPIWLWSLIGGVALFLSAFLYWAFVITEGAYLGARIVAWTYDLAASKYDAIKQFSPLDDTWLLASPMVNRLRHVNGPLILDVATGTGRLPLALLHHGRFRGYVIALDLSTKMLRQAEQKLGKHEGRWTLVRRDAQDLPFPDHTFDAVSCLEALEFMPSSRRVLGEMARVLRPGGIFLVTNRVNWERKLMPGKAFTDDEIRALLQEAGLTDIEIRPWQVYYDLIWARGAGDPSGLGHATWELGKILRCAHCSATPLDTDTGQIHCPTCDRTYPVDDHIVHMT